MLVLTGDTELAAALTARCEAAGHRAVPVLPVPPGAAEPASGAGHRHVLRTGDPEDARRLVRELARAGLVPDAVVCCPPDGPDELSTAALPGLLGQGPEPFLQVLTALLATASGPRDLRAVYGYRAPTPGSRPYDAAMAAALRGLALEHGRFGAARLAVEGADAFQDPDRLAGWLLAELGRCRPGEAAQLRRRGGRRQARALRPVEPPPPAARPCGRAPSISSPAEPAPWPATSPPIWRPGPRSR
ncbi:hypothetical protein ACRAR1_14525 [Streptomyces sanyensis]|uniref:hypothetical protein n=1 Tax=Streptomyces sanyensis TaxID=568869 RepID=UPI003D7758F2